MFSKKILESTEPFASFDRFFFFVFFPLLPCQAFSPHFSSNSPIAEYFLLKFNGYSSYFNSLPSSSVNKANKDQLYSIKRLFRKVNFVSLHTIANCYS